MTEELKARIAQINAGTAPAGYKKTKVGIVPEEWETVRLREMFDISAGGDIDKEHCSKSQNNTYKYPVYANALTNMGLYGYSDEYKVQGDTITVTGRGEIGVAIARINEKYFPIVRLLVLKPLVAVNIVFVEHQINMTKIYIESTGVPQLTAPQLSVIKILLPPLPEQQKIAEILTAQDAVIALMQKQIELLQKQKKAFLQKMFPKKGSNVPEIRFAGFTDAWEQYHLGDLYIERNEKGNDSLPILSVSIHSGVSDGELDTETLGKIVRRSEDKSTYKHVFCGDLVFNMMRAWQGAIGVVKREGMVSPAYISAIPNEKVYPPFMNYLLRRKAAVDQINDLSYGVTDFRKRLYWKSFIRVSCQLPSLQEQKMITELFESLDALIDQHQRKLELEQQKKKALMQLLLTGKVRVKT